MSPAPGASTGPTAVCVCCDKPVARMHGLVVLLRNGKRGVSFRLATAGYCAQHREDAIDVALEPFRGHGQIVTVSSPDLVRPSKQLAWRRATVTRLTDAAQEILESSALADAPEVYPDESPGVDAARVGDLVPVPGDGMTPTWLAPVFDAAGHPVRR